MLKYFVIKYLRKLGKKNIINGQNFVGLLNDRLSIDTLVRGGHEFEILKNMHTLIKKYKPIIQIEVLDSEYSKNSYPKTIKYLKNELNYKYFYIPNNPIKIRRRNLILKEYYNLKYFFNNLLFFKEKLILIEKFENISYPAIFCTNYKIRKNN